MQRFVSKPLTRPVLNRITFRNADISSCAKPLVINNLEIKFQAFGFSLATNRREFSLYAAPNNQKVQSSSSFPTPYGQHKNTKPMTVNDNLPDPFAELRKVKYQFAAFICVVTVAFLMIVNYEKMSSPMIGSTMHFMRRSPEVKQLLESKDIDFDSIFPWIKGTLNQVQGKIDVSFNVKGVQSGMVGTVRLIADRPNKHVPLTIREWSVTTGDKKIDIMLNEELDF